MDETYKRLHPVLLSIDTLRENLFRKFRPMMGVFAFYFFVCLLFPYVDLGVPRYLRGGVFYFLLVAGALGLFVVLTIYYRQMQELSTLTRARLAQGLAARLQGISYLEQDQDLEQRLKASSLFGTFDSYEGSDLLKVDLGAYTLQEVQVRLTRTVEANLPRSVPVFSGRVYVIEYQDIAQLSAKGVIHFEKPKFRSGVPSSRPSLADETEAKLSGYTDALLTFLGEISTEAFQRRQVTMGLSFFFGDDHILIRFEENRKFTEMFNWEPWNTPKFLDSRLWIWYKILTLNKYL